MSKKPKNIDKSCEICRRPTISDGHWKCAECYKQDKLEQSWTGESRGVASETDVYQAMERQVRILTEHQTKILENGSGESLKDEAKMLGDASKALASIGREILNFQKAELNAIEDMNDEQWAEAVSAWFSKLSRSKADRVLSELTQIHWDSRSRVKRLAKEKANKEKLQ